MKLRINILALTLVFAACSQSPHSKWQVHNAGEDQLSNQQKIDLFIKGSDKLSSSSLAAIAQLYENQAAWNQAMASIKQAIRVDPMNSSYHSLKAKYAYALGQKSIAYREALTAYQLGAKSLQQSLDLAKMGIALSEYSIVESIIDSLLIAYPEDVDVLYMAARKHDKNNNVGLAISYYEKVYRRAPENQDNTLFYAQLLFRQNETQTAKIILQESITDNSSRQLYLLQGDVYTGLELYDSAVLYYHMALAESTDTTTYNKILKANQLAGNTESLIGNARAAVQSFPANKTYLLLAARALDQRYLYNDALPYYLSLYQLDTLDTLVSAELSYLQRKIAYLQRQRQEEKKLADSLSYALKEEI